MKELPDSRYSLIPSPEPEFDWYRQEVSGLVSDEEEETPLFTSPFRSHIMMNDREQPSLPMMTSPLTLGEMGLEIVGDQMNPLGFVMNGQDVNLNAHVNAPQVEEVDMSGTGGILKEEAEEPFIDNAEDFAEMIEAVLEIPKPPEQNELVGRRTRPIVKCIFPYSGLITYDRPHIIGNATHPVLSSSWARQFSQGPRREPEVETSSDVPKTSQRMESSKGEMKRKAEPTESSRSTAGSKSVEKKKKPKLPEKNRSTAGSKSVEKMKSELPEKNRSTAGSESLEEKKKPELPEKGRSTAGSKSVEKKKKPDLPEKSTDKCKATEEKISGKIAKEECNEDPIDPLEVDDVLPYKCSYCGLGFSGKSLLTRHENIHKPTEPGGKLVYCMNPFCRAPFNIQYTMLKHFQKCFIPVYELELRDAPQEEYDELEKKFKEKRKK